MTDKKFVPFLYNGNLFFIGQDKEEESNSKVAAKPAPSVTSLNRELSAVSYSYAQLNAILGPYTMHRLLSQAKLESDLKKSGVTTPKEDSQEFRNQLRIALETLCQVDAQTLAQQYRSLGGMTINPPQPGGSTVNQPRVMEHGETASLNAISQFDDGEFDKKDIFEYEHGKEIQGAAELTIRPSLIATMKSDTNLNIEYKKMVTEQIARNSREAIINETETAKSPTSRGCSECGSPEKGSTSSNAVRGAAGKANSSEHVSTEEDSLELSYMSEELSDMSYTYSSYSSSSLETANDPTILYPTAATCSYSVDSDSDLQSTRTANDGWRVNGLNNPRRVNSVSTGIWLSNCSEPPSSLCSAHSFSSVDFMTADLYTGDMETAEAAESEIEAANRVFDIILSAKCANVQPACGDSETSQGGSVKLKTANSSSFEVSAMKAKTKLPWLPLFDTDDTRTAIEGPIELRTAWERVSSDSTACPVSEDCITGEEHSESFMSATSTSGCGAQYCSFMASDEGEMREIESQANMGTTRG
ncbi:hypothetical protein GCK32_002898 [Trichostrongylus colubriformis]|uniref:Uncharacterized protein n=1 Tax=Trichostrongylus colubriformis TaxID=6319 RepID=A0AAN8FJ52_TRICO